MKHLRLLELDWYISYFLSSRISLHTYWRINNCTTTTFKASFHGGLHMAPPQPLLRKNGGWTPRRLFTASCHHGCPGWGVGDWVCRLCCLHTRSWGAASARRLSRLDWTTPCVRVSAYQWILVPLCRPLPTGNTCLRGWSPGMVPGT
jgi:hypothetical protein